jgi:PAS domain S-box-containing protein
MTRSLFRLPLAEICAVVGVVFGVWLIHNTFQPAADTPNYVLLSIGALDILLCFGLLGHLLRGRLRAEEALPKSWIVAGVVLIAWFLGWIAALFLDSDRLLVLQQHHGEYVQQLTKLEDSLNHFSAVLPAQDFTVDTNAWKTNHDGYARVHDQLRASLKSNASWDKELTRIDDEVQQMSKLFNLMLTPNPIEIRLQWRADFAHARERAATQCESLRNEIAKAEGDFAATHRARWHAVGASALAGVFMMLGCLLFWLLFDRELRRSWKAQSRLAGNEARFRWLIENQSEPLAVLDNVGNILYVNPVWKTAFGYELDELQNGNLLELVHPQDRPRIQTALRTNDAQHAIPCRLSADYGVWHDVELQCQQHDDAGTSVVRVHDVRETPDVPMHPQPELLPDATEKLKAAETRMNELESECAELRERESHANKELQQHRWLLDSHTQANSEGVLILSARGEVLSWNPSFVRLWKLSDETMSAHTWLTVAAHMESQVEAGWDEFQRAVAPDSLHTDTCWEMTLEGDRTFEVYAQAMHDVPGSSPLTPNPSPTVGRGEILGAIQFHFRDVTRHKDMQNQLRDHREQLSEHEEHKKSYESNLREHEKRLKHLERQLRERDEHRTELESTLRDHQDRLHQMHETHESHETTLKASKEAMRRLASGVANDLNNVLSVVLGNTEVLRDNLPKDHVAQNYLDDIHQAAGRGTELSQRLLAYSRNHLLQMEPVEMNQQLTALEAKIRVALGHVQLHWERADQELWVKTDAHPLEQALLHLVTHIRSHMPEGGTLTIRTARTQLARNELTHADMAPGAYIQLRLQHTGDGIDDGNLAHVFEPYHSVKEGQKGDLTLATAYGIVRQSGGCIDVSSEKGKGTEWTILLPETAERPQHGTHDTPLRASA